MESDKWVKSSFSNGSGGNNCVEVRKPSNVEGVILRNSKLHGSEVPFSRMEWEAFIAGVKAGEFDL